MTGRIMTKAEKDDYPGPGTHPHVEPMKCNPKTQATNIMIGNGKGDKTCGFIDEAKFHG